MKERMWAIAGVHGLYVGTWQTRREAIESHTQQLSMPWIVCKSELDTLRARAEQAEATLARVTRLRDQWAKVDSGPMNGLRLEHCLRELVLALIEP